MLVKEEGAEEGDLGEGLEEGSELAGARAVLEGVEVARGGAGTGSFSSAWQGSPCTRIWRLLYWSSHVLRSGGCWCVLNPTAPTFLPAVWWIPQLCGRGGTAGKGRVAGGVGVEQTRAS